MQIFKLNYGLYNQYAELQVSFSVLLYRTYVNKCLGVLYDLVYNPFPKNLPFLTLLYRNIYKIQLLAKSLLWFSNTFTLIRPNSHETCILGLICSSNYFVSKCWPKPP